MKPSGKAFSSPLDKQRCCSLQERKEAVSVPATALLFTGGKSSKKEGGGRCQPVSHPKEPSPGTLEGAQGRNQTHVVFGAQKPFVSIALSLVILGFLSWFSPGASSFRVLANQLSPFLHSIPCLFCLLFPGMTSALGLCFGCPGLVFSELRCVQTRLPG